VQDLQCSFQIYTSGFTGKGKYRCRIYNAVSRSTLQVSQGLAGIIRGAETTLQSAKSFIYRIEEKRAATGKLKLNSRRREGGRGEGGRGEGGRGEGGRGEGGRGEG
jgi:hypothetical protein